MSEALVQQPIVEESETFADEPPQCDSEQLAFPKLDGILFPTVVANADVVAGCPWMGGAEVSLTFALNNYYQPMTEENADQVIADVYDFLANQIAVDDEVREPEPPQPENTIVPPTRQDDNSTEKGAATIEKSTPTRPAVTLNNNAAATVLVNVAQEASGPSQQTGDDDTRERNAKLNLSTPDDDPEGALVVVSAPEPVRTRGPGIPTGVVAVRQDVLEVIDQGVESMSYQDGDTGPALVERQAADTTEDTDNTRDNPVPPNGQPKEQGDHELAGPRSVETHEVEPDASELTYVNDQKPEDESVGADGHETPEVEAAPRRQTIDESWQVSDGKESPNQAELAAEKTDEPRMDLTWRADDTEREIPEMGEDEAAAAAATLDTPTEPWLVHDGTLDIPSSARAATISDFLTVMEPQPRLEDEEDYVSRAASPKRATRKSGVMSSIKKSLMHAKAIGRSALRLNIVNAADWYGVR